MSSPPEDEASADVNQRTLTDIEAKDWGEVPPPAMPLMRDVYGLRHKPLAEFTAEDLETMVGQQVSLPWLMPIALDLLEHDLLLEAFFYPGDLLASVLRVKPEFWKLRPDLAARLETYLPEEIKPGDPDNELDPGESIAQFLNDLVATFRARGQ